MAFTLSTIYKAVDKFSPIVKRMEKANSSFASKQDQAFRKMGRSISNVKNQLIGLAGGLSIASVLAIGGGAVVKFDSNLQSLSAITGATGKQLDSFKLKSIEVANDVKQSATDVLTAFELVGSAKPELLKNADALGEVSKQALILSKAGKLLPEDAVNALAVSLNQFGAGAEKAAMFTDILATAQQKGSGTISYLREAIVKSGSTMRTFGTSFEDTVTILEGFAKAGIEASISGTALSGIMGRLAKAQRKEFNPQYTSAIDIIDNLAKAKLSYTEVEKLVGLQQAKNLLALINQNDIIQELRGNLNETGNAQAQMSTQTASFAEKLKQLRARFENLIIKGNENSKTLNKLGGIIEFVTKHLDKILKVVGLTIAAFTSYYALMTTIRIATTAYNIVLGLFYATQSAVPISLAASTAAMKAYAIAQKIGAAATWLFNSALWANPITWVIIGIVALVAGIILLIIKWKQVVAWFKQTKAFIVVLKIMEVMKKVFKSVGSVFAWVGDKIKAVWQWIKKIASVAFGPVLKLIDKFSGDNKTEINVNRNEKENPVNIQKANNEAITNRYEEITMNKLEIELNNKTDKKANVKMNQALIPITTNTF